MSVDLRGETRGEPTDKRVHFGAFLKDQRIARGLSIADLSRATKIKETSLELLEGADLEALPAPVFVRGFVSAYAREVGVDEHEALRRYRQLAAQRGGCKDVSLAEAEKPLIQRAPDPDGEPAGDRRRFGVVMVVLLILVVATLTLSLLLGHGHKPGAGISFESAGSDPLSPRT
jgi:cytoskeletal protein RodZ